MNAQMALTLMVDNQYSTVPKLATDRLLMAKIRQPGGQRRHPYRQRGKPESHVRTDGDRFTANRYHLAGRVRVAHQEPGQGLR